jgi:hypothetical protein
MKKSLLIASMLVVLLLQVPVFADDAYGHIGLTEEPQTLDAMLRVTLEDEYLARAEYALILDEYGDVRPFSQIIKAEERHIESLLRLFESLDMEAPADLSTDFVAFPTSIDAALAVGIEAEIANIALYERFLSDESQELPANVERVFSALQRASENHLAAFERRANGTGAGGRGGPSS